MHFKVAFPDRNLYIGLTRALHTHTYKMGNSVDTIQAAATNKPDESSTNTVKKPACKACCACPETKKVRDAW